MYLENNFTSLPTEVDTGGMRDKMPESQALAFDLLRTVRLSLRHVARYGKHGKERSIKPPPTSGRLKREGRTSRPAHHRAAFYTPAGSRWRSEPFFNRWPIRLDQSRRHHREGVLRKKPSLIATHSGGFYANSVGQA